MTESENIEDLIQNKIDVNPNFSITDSQFWLSSLSNEDEFPYLLIYNFKITFWMIFVIKL